MGYHDRMPPSYNNKTGIGVVNPLLDLQERLDTIQKILSDLPENAMTTAELSQKIQKVLNGEE